MKQHMTLPEPLKVTAFSCRRRPQHSSSASRQHCEPRVLRLWPDAKLTANSRLERLKTHPEDVIALRASARYLHALRSSHAVTLLGVFKRLWQAVPQQCWCTWTLPHTGTRRQTTGLWCACVVTWQEITPFCNFQILIPIFLIPKSYTAYGF